MERSEPGHTEEGEIFTQNSRCCSDVGVLNESPLYIPTELVSLGIVGIR